MEKEVLKVAGNEEFNETKCPFPLHVIPDVLGINLCSVDSVSWVKQPDGQLVNIHIDFIPA